MKLVLLENFYCQQDNNPNHMAKIVKEQLLYNTTHVLRTLPQNPDINPIEHLWGEIDKKLKNYDITSKDVLRQKIVEIWNSI